MKQTLSIKSNLFMVRELRDYLGIALGMILYGIGWTVFLLPNDLPSGAVPGIASIVYWGTGLRCNTLILPLMASFCCYHSRYWDGSLV